MRFYKLFTSFILLLNYDILMITFLLTWLGCQPLLTYFERHVRMALVNPSQGGGPWATNRRPSGSAPPKGSAVGTVEVAI